ncbi:MAG: alpha/beta fold hydrolase [bacterium]
MNKRVIIVHGWDFKPTDHWYPWVKFQLEQKGFEVIVPSMPDTAQPVIEAWVNCLAEAVCVPGTNTILIGHSIGCQTILRYLERLPDNERIKGMVLVAGWFTLQGLETYEEKQIAYPWLSTHIDFNKVKERCSKIVTVFSDNDPYVPLEDVQLFKERLGAEVVMEHEKGHFTQNDGVFELASVVRAVEGLG